MSDYPVKDGRLCTPEGCEVNLVDHCNLSCRSCSHLSPVLPKSRLDPERIHRDLSTLAKVYRPRFVKLLGGEPLLHARLLDALDAVAKSGLCARVLVCTNGLLLDRMPDAFFAAVSEVEISHYPGAGPSEAALGRARARAREHGTTLTVMRYSRFRESYAALGTRDRRLVRRIYATCKVAHLWRCHTVHDGTFAKCPQAIYLPRVVPRAAARADAIEIRDAPDFRDELAAYLRSDEPLAACAFCLGSVGKLRAHEQVARRRFRALQAHATEALLDPEHLAACERDLASWDGCAVRAPDPAAEDVCAQ